jgi:hypothetical protein
MVGRSLLYRGVLGGNEVGAAEVRRTDLSVEVL